MGVPKRYRRLGQLAGTGRRCWYCGDRLRRSKMSKDHQIPKSVGGTSAADNLVLACRKCNGKKADRDVEEYRLALEDEEAAGERIIFYGEQVLRRLDAAFDAVERRRG
jgi:5-methylcytosine-specific restriction endonuclease McrA